MFYRQVWAKVKMQNFGLNGEKVKFLEGSKSNVENVRTSFTLKPIENPKKIEILNNKSEPKFNSNRHVDGVYLL